MEVLTRDQILEIAFNVLNIFVTYPQSACTCRVLGSRLKILDACLGVFDMCSGAGYRVRVFFFDPLSCPCLIRIKHGYLRSVDTSVLGYKLHL